MKKERDINDKRDVNDKNWQPSSQDDKKERPIEEVRQQQTDPNITELKGFVDPNEKLEPEGTDNDFSDTV